MLRLQTRVAKLLRHAINARDAMEAAQRQIEAALGYNFDRPEWIESSAADLIAEAQGGSQ